MVHKIKTLLLMIFAITGLSFFDTAHCSGALSELAIQTTISGKTELIRIDDDLIESHKIVLQKDQRSNVLTQYALKSAAFAVLVYVAYGYLQPWFITQTPSRFPENLEQRLMQLESTVLPSLFSWQWFKNNAMNVVTGTAVATIANAGSSAIGDFNREIFHSGSLEWFVQHKTSLIDLAPYQIDLRSSSMLDLQMYATMLKNQDRIKKSIIEDLKDYLNAFDNSEYVSSETTLMSLYLIRSTCNTMTAEIALILGFMAMKQELIKGPVALEIKTNIRYIRNRTNQFCNTLEAILSDQTSEGNKKKQDSVSALNELKGELRRIINRFTTIERESKI